MGAVGFFTAATGSLTGRWFQSPLTPQSPARNLNEIIDSLFTLATERRTVFQLLGVFGPSVGNFPRCRYSPI